MKKPIPDKYPVWVMPAWMEPYREHINNTGGNTVEQLANGRTDARINLPLAMLEVAVYCQVRLLQSLHSAGLLRGGKPHA